MGTQLATPSPTRVAVLGGGAGALATAFALTKRGGYDITVYQMGWRLGGKCASGRRTDGRVQEHGLHVLGGFYHNSLGLLREVYEAWPSYSAHAMTFDEAFLPHSLVHIIEHGPDGSYPVHFPFPENAEPLGLRPKDLDLITIAKQLLSYIAGLTGPERPKPRGADYAHDATFLALLEKSIAAADPDALRRAGGDRQALRTQPDVTALKQTLAIMHEGRALPTPPPRAQEPDYGILFELALVTALGILEDGLYWKGFDAANGLEFEAWMICHGLSQRTRSSAYFRCGYDYAFAYKDGDPHDRMMAAGTGLRGFLRMVFTYNRSVFVHMNGSMGEIIFTPLYEVLRARGVKFRFFHRIDALQLDDDGIRLQKVVGTVQAHPIAEEYDPLVSYSTPAGCVRLVWPPAPIADRLNDVQPTNGRAEFIYETPWSAPTAATPFSLTADDDFDIVVLGIPVGALPIVATDLIDRIPEWRAMLDNSATTPTIAAQLWQPETTAALGWPNGQTILTANAPPHSTWADMNFLLPLEASRVSRHLSYFCGPVPVGDVLPTSDYGAQELLRAEATTRAWMDMNLAGLMPKAHVPPATIPGDPDELYVRINSFPSDLYVLTVPGAVQYRLTPGGSFVPNMFLAGDWTRNGYDIGSFETAMLSGLQCARAIAGDSLSFPGETDRVG